MNESLHLRLQLAIISYQEGPHHRYHSFITLILLSYFIIIMSLFSRIVS